MKFKVKSIEKKKAQYKNVSKTYAFVFKRMKTNVWANEHEYYVVWQRVRDCLIAKYASNEFIVVLLIDRKQREKTSPTMVSHTVIQQGAIAFFMKPIYDILSPCSMELMFHYQR